MDNYQERMEQINRERLERRMRIEEYLDKQAETPTSETELFNFVLNF